MLVSLLCRPLINDLLLVIGTYLPYLQIPHFLYLNCSSNLESNLKVKRYEMLKM